MALVLEGYGYLEAWCYSASALRTFRLDRIAAVEVTDIDASSARRRRAQGFVDGLVRDAERCATRGSGTRSGGGLGGGEYYPTETVNRDERGDVTVALRVTDPAWLRGCCCVWRAAPG